MTGREEGRIEVEKKNEKKLNWLGESKDNR